MRARGAIVLVVAAACAPAPLPAVPKQATRGPAPPPSPPVETAFIEPAAAFETEAARFVVEAGVPTWLRARVTRDVTGICAFYASKLGPLPAPKPTVRLSFGTREHGKSIGGEADAGNLIVMRVELEPPAARDPDVATLLRIDELVAHEAGHLWAGPYAGGEGNPRWIHEGLPDAFAVRALRAIGAASDADYRNALSEAASECAMWLRVPRGCFSDGLPPPNRASYVCGSSVALATEASYAKARPGTDLFSFWLAVRALPLPLAWPDAFFTPLSVGAKKPAVSADLQHVVNVTEPTAGEFLRKALLEAGLTLVDHPSGPFPDDYEQHASVPAVEALLPSSCAGALTFDGDSEVLPRVTFDGACPGLANGDRIESLAGIPLGAKGATAWDAGYASCQSRHSVDVGVRGNTVSVPCDPAARPRPAYFDVQGAP